MPCIITGGYANTVCRGIAGIQAVYIGLYNGPSMTYTLSGAPSYSITAFTGTTQSFYKFDQAIETGSLTTAGNFSDQNGTAHYEQIVEITCIGISGPLNELVNNLGKGRWRILVLDQNGNYFLVGKVNPATVTAVAGGPGKAYGDLQGYTITFTSKEPDVPYAVTSAAALTLINNTATIS